MSNARSLAQSFSPEAAASSQPLREARPKVMRRPAQFSSSRSPTTSPNAPVTGAINLQDTRIDSTPLPQLSPPAPATKLWQDDARFGIAMLTIVVLVNLALILWLPHMRTTLAPIAPITPIITSPTPVESSIGEVEQSPPLTLYTKPDPAPAPDGWTPTDTTAPTILRAPLFHGADSGPNQ
jgi:hypothetical protein